MEATITPVLGSDFDAVIPDNGHSPHQIFIKDATSAGTWSGDQLRNTVWSARYAGLFFFNRSPWVEHGYVGPVSDVKLPDHPSDAPPPGAWVLELLDASDQPGALGYHEGQSRVSKAGPSGVHSERGIALHPATGEEIVLMKVFVKTSREDGVPPTEVLTHELFEAAVDPYVNNDSEIRVYTNPADGKEYIAEVGDPVQSRAWDVGAPEGRPCGVPEAMISDFAYPKWWGQEQRREAVCFCDDAEEWATLPNVPRLAPFQLAAGGYMSVRTPGGEWTQIYGSDRPKAEANAHAYEGAGETDNPTRKEPMSWSASVPATLAAEFDAAVDAAAVSPPGELAPEVTTQVTAARAAVKALVASGSFDANTAAYNASLSGHACVDGAPGAESISVFVAATTPPAAPAAAVQEPAAAEPTAAEPAAEPTETAAAEAPAADAAAAVAQDPAAAQAAQPDPGAPAA